jgi:hypothetical protein
MGLLIDIIYGVKLSGVNKIKKIINKKYNRFYPNNARHDDVYIVEFPKSGVTWLSTLIANVNLLKSEQDESVTFYNLSQYIPDIHTTKDLAQTPLWESPKYRFIKSHDNYNKNYGFVIYLIRNPLRVMNSYYEFMQVHGSFHGTFEEFVKSPSYGIKAWNDHVNSWIKELDPQQKIHLIKYEDLMEKPKETLRNIYDNIGLCISDEILLESIKRSSLERMRNSESVYSTYNPFRDIAFVGKGAETYSKNMNDDIKEYIVSNSKIYFNNLKNIKCSNI